MSEANMPQALTPQALTEAQVRFYHENGYFFPIPVFDESETRNLRAALRGAGRARGRTSLSADEHAVPIS